MAVDLRTCAHAHPEHLQGNSKENKLRALEEEDEEMMLHESEVSVPEVVLDELRW